ncbi:amidohydrolase family protein [Herbiconiux sp. UC225_62]|uniref:amidohydrolase family protein n=1 Tax=Herbiconiux sp. UC225_62 TaxID=3350168 RepID=UPI0036D3CECC
MVDTDTAEQTRGYRRIACEEGVATRTLLEANARLGDIGLPLLTLDGPAAFLAERLIDHDARLAAMDRDGIDLQLLMVSAPGVQVFSPADASALAADVNDELAELCRSHPTRFAALAAVAPHDPLVAAAEVERAVRELGLRGAVVNSHTQGVYLDDPASFPLLEALEALEAPLYIHPREAPAPMRPFLAGPAVEGAVWEYAVEVGTHVLRMIGAGVLDRFPRLQIVVGHMGEGLPFWLPRIDNRYLASVHGPRRAELLPSEYIHRQVSITTSGMNFLEPLRLAIDVLGTGKVLYASDYPFEEQGAAVAAIEAMPLDEAQRRALFETNAARVFSL